jgi:predicted transposase YdaD
MLKDNLFYFFILLSIVVLVFYLLHQPSRLSKYENFELLNMDNIEIIGDELCESNKETNKTS